MQTDGLGFLEAPEESPPIFRESLEFFVKRKGMRRLRAEMVRPRGHCIGIGNGESGTTKMAAIAHMSGYNVGRHPQLG